MNEVLRVTKIVLLLEQCAFIVKRYYETHSLKCIRDDFTQEFPNFVSSLNHAILNLIKKFKNEHLFDDLRCSV